MDKNKGFIVVSDLHASPALTAAIVQQVTNSVRNMAGQMMQQWYRTPIVYDLPSDEPILRTDMNIKWICDYAGILNVTDTDSTKCFRLHLRKMTVHAYDAKGKFKFATKLYLYKKSVAFERDRTRYYSPELEPYFQQWIANRVTK